MSCLASLPFASTIEWICYLFPTLKTMYVFLSHTKTAQNLSIWAAHICFSPPCSLLRHMAAAAVLINIYEKSPHHFLPPCGNTWGTSPPGALFSFWILASARGLAWGRPLPIPSRFNAGRACSFFIQIKWLNQNPYKKPTHSNGVQAIHINPVPWSVTTVTNATSLNCEILFWSGGCIMRD